MIAKNVHFSLFLVNIDCLAVFVFLSFTFERQLLVVQRLISNQEKAYEIFGFDHKLCGSSKMNRAEN